MSPAKHIKIYVWPAIAVFLICIFLGLTSEIREAAAGQPEFIGTVDKVFMEWAFKLRTPRLVGFAANVTALGSTLVLTAWTIAFALLMFLLKKNRLALHMIGAGIAAGALTKILKSVFERDRPSQFVTAVEAQGFSYPSGHSLASAAIYLTIAILASQFYRTLNQRLIIYSVFSVLILLVGLSRIYLGVHYPSDVIGGILVGSALAISLGGIQYAR